MDGRRQDWAGDAVFAASPAVRTLRLGEQTALFCSRTQQLSELNPAAHLAWSSLRSGHTFAEAVAQVKASGGGADAEGFVASIVGEWRRRGYLIPLAVIELAAGVPRVSSIIQIGAFTAKINFFGEADASAAMRVFGHLAVPERTCALRVDVIGLDGEDTIFVDAAPIGSAEPNETAPRIKALLTQHYCDSIDDGFLAHAGLVSRNGRRVLISGPPGAGKTTLVLALCAGGFAYGSDDIIHIDDQGRARGAPFAAAAKRGAWPILKQRIAAFDGLDVHRRTDGQDVRYVPPERLEQESAQPIDIYLQLARAPGARAKLKPLAPLSVLCAILESGYSHHAAIEGSALSALADSISSAQRYTLAYEALDDAVELVGRCVDE